MGVFFGESEQKKYVLSFFQIWGVLYPLVENWRAVCLTSDMVTFGRSSSNTFVIDKDQAGDAINVISKVRTSFFQRCSLHTFKILGKIRIWNDVFIARFFFKVYFVTYQTRQDFFKVSLISLFVILKGYHQ